MLRYWWCNRQREGRLLLTGASVGLIVLITLSPFDFSFSEPVPRTGRSSVLVGWGKSSDADVLLNAVLFIPLGFGLASVLPRRRWLTGLTSLAMILGMCFALSYTIEVLQQFLPSRYPSLRDVFANSFGGGLGWSGFESLVWARNRWPRGEGRT